MTESHPRNVERRVARLLWARLWIYRGELLASILLAFGISALFAGTLIVLKPAADLLFDPAGLENLRQQRWVGPWLANLVAPWLENKERALLGVAGLVLALGLLKNLLRYYQEYLSAYVGERLVIDLSNDLYRHIQRFEPSFFAREGSQQLVSRFVNDTVQVGGGLAKIFARIVREPLKALGAFAIAAAIDPWLTLVCCVLFPLALALMLRIGRAIKKRYRTILERRQEILGQLGENFRGIRIVQAFNLESHFERKLYERNEALFEEIRQAMRLDVATSPALESMIHLVGAGVVFYTGLQVLGQQMPPGNFLLFYATIAALFDPVSKLSGINNKLQSALAAAARVFWLLEQQPAICDAPNAAKLPLLHHEIRFAGVSYSYDGANPNHAIVRPAALQNIDLTIRRGEMVGIVGRTGSGKSTLISLLPRFADPTAGSITIDGIDLRSVRLADLRSQIALVTQDHLLWDDSIATNIRLGRLEATAAEVEAAARAAYIHEMVMALPRGYDTVIGEAGVTISGGEKQRLALARAILKNPRILILDEATSNLDADSEAIVQRALEAFVADRTTLVIAHRLSTLKHADRIVVLEAGRIENIGTHDELMRSSTIYPRLVSGGVGGRLDASATSTPFAP